MRAAEVPFAPLMGSTEAAFCNANIVRLIEEMLATAKRGDVGYLAMVMASNPNNLKAAISGSQGLEWVAMAGLKEIYRALAAEKRNRTMPRRVAELDDSYACYNMPALAFSYDFLSWLVDAEMTRVREGAPGPLKVAFWPGRDGKCKALQAFESCRTMLDRVMRAALPLLGAVEEPLALAGRAKELACSFDIAAAARVGETVPRFHPTATAAFEHRAWLWSQGIESRYVTITLRESPSWPHRNSNIEAWLKMARYLEKSGTRVVFVRDTAKVMAPPLGPYAECPFAALSLDRRCALYADAACNFFVANGPCDLAAYMDAPWLTFINVQPDGHAYTADTPGFWRERKGVEVGDQYPWSSDKQRIVWAKDDYPKILRAWGEFFE